MRKVLALAFIATIGSLVMIGQPAEAMIVAAPSALASVTPIEKATVVCGSNGCVPVHVSGPKKKTHP